jgi:pimeloyl-ACP methyl ester carboxylesterase
MSSGIPKLVLLPGMDGTGDLFAPFVQALPQGFEVQIVRYPADRALSSPELAQLLESVTVGSEPFVLLAESFSSPLAIEWAATDPPNLRGLVICAGFASSPIPSWLRSICSFLAPMCFLVTPPPIAIKLLLVGTNPPNGMVAAVQSAISSVKQSVLCARLRNILACDVRSALSRVTTPMLFVQAKRDRLVGGTMLEEMRKLKPSATVETIDGPHLLLQREPKGSARAVVRFAARCGV